jgi:hypothetical protein
MVVARITMCMWGRTAPRKSRNLETARIAASGWRVGACAGGIWGIGEWA